MSAAAAATWKPPVAQLLAARALGCKEDDESEPYKSKYAASDLLEQLIQEVQHARADCQDEQGAAEASEFVSWCKLERGLLLLETDLLAEGQKLLEQGLSHAWPGTVECMAIQLQAHNALASLWCDRGENTTALEHLRLATELHSMITQLQHACQGQQEQPPQEHDSAPNALGLPAAHMDQQPFKEEQEDKSQQAQQQQQQVQQGDSQQGHLAEAEGGLQQMTLKPAPHANSSSWQAAVHDGDSVERNHTTTLFYMAQVYGLMGDKLQSASYCAATLNRQLKQGEVDLNEWIQNCLQLSGCFLDCNAFALSQHCCAAVEALLLQQHEPEQQQAAHGSDVMPGSPPGRDKAMQGQPQQQHEQQQQEQGQEQQQAHSACKDQKEGKDQADKPAHQQKASASKMDLQQDEHAEVSATCGPPAALLSALALLDHDVAANVCLAQAKLQLYLLVTSHEAVLEGKPVSFAYSSAAAVPAVLCFDALPGLPALSSLAWGRDALAARYEEALQLFKTALPWFKRALDYYKLDGWVTEHCNILFEMSNLYRCLAGFEPDPHRRCVMHRSRAKLLQPLEGQLSTTHYPGLSRSISLELGNIFREIADIKGAAGWEPDKVAAAMQAAAQHYRLFLDSFRDEAGQLPHKVESEMQQHYLSCMFSMARMLQGLPGTGTLGATGTDMEAPGAQSGRYREEVANLEQAVSLLGSLVKYVHSNHVADWQEQAAMAGELSGLLQEKLALLRHAF